MKKSRQTKRALIPSVLAVIMCVAMLIGTTFAWFTDTASTSVNKIQAGKLDVTLYYKDVEAEGKPWKDAEGKTLSFLRSDDSGNLKQDDTILWEPGCTYKLPELKIVNKGNLALKYSVKISGIVGDAELLKAIDFTVTKDAKIESGTSTTSKLESWEDSLAAGESQEFTISGKMQEGAGNDYQGDSISGIAITVLAKQDTVEYDSTTKDYDAQAGYDEYTAPVSGKKTVAVTADKTTVTIDNTNKEISVNKVVTETGQQSVTVSTAEKVSEGENADPVASATIPDGAFLNEGETTVTLSVTPTSKLASGTATAIATATEKETKSFEIKMDGLSKYNDKPITVEFYTDTNLKNVVVYHNGVKMDGQSTADNGGQYYTYDKNSGKVTVVSKTFSPFDIVYDKPGTETYTLEQFNALAEIPEGVKTVYLDIGTVSLENSSVVIGNDNLRDKYARGTSNGEITYTGKAGIDLIIDGGTIKDGPAVDNSVTHKIAFKIPDKSTVTFKNVKIEGFFGLTSAGEDNPYGTPMHGKVASVTFDGCTFDALWLQNGQFYTSQITIKNSTFNKHENSVYSGNTNPLWFKNIGQTGTSISIDNCTFNTNRPVKVVEQDVSGQTVSITNCTFNMENDAENKNAAIMFSTTSAGSTLGKVVVSGNKVNSGVALLTFYNPAQITMAEGATFTVSNNTLGTDVKTSVVWKSTTEFSPDFVK